MTKRRVGIAGLGQVGLLYAEDPRIRRRYPYSTHATAFATHPRIELIAAADPDPARRALAAARHDTIRLYPSHREMLERERLDILSVCVPTNRHETVVGDALAAGVSLIFCEKPFTPDLATARRLLERARADGASIVVNYFRRFDEAHQAVHDLVARGELGHIRRVHATYGNGLAHTGSHVANLLLWYLGAARWVSAVPIEAESEGDPALDLTIGFASGVLATLTACSYEHYRILELDLLGTRGRVSITDEGLRIRVHEVAPHREVSGASMLSRRPRRIASTVGHAFLAAVDYLVGILDRGEHHLPLDAIDTHAILAAARQSAREDGARVELARDEPALADREEHRV